MFENYAQSKEDRIARAERIIQNKQPTQTYYAVKYWYSYYKDEVWNTFILHSSLKDLIYEMKEFENGVALLHEPAIEKKQIYMIVTKGILKGGGDYQWQNVESDNRTRTVNLVNHRIYGWSKEQSSVKILRMIPIG